MSILEELEDLKKQKQELEGTENSEEQSEAIDLDAGDEQSDDSQNESEGGQDDGEEEGVGDEEDKSGDGDSEEEAKPEPKEEAGPTDSDFARMRREKRALEKRIAELESAKNQPPKDHDEGDQAAAVNEELRDILYQRKVEKAEREFLEMEQSFRASAADYDDVSQQYKAGVYQAQRIMDPKASHYELLERTKMQILNTASKYINQGYDPIEELYNEAKHLGMGAAQPASQSQEDQPKKAPVVDHNKLAKNRSKNAGTLGTPGNSGKPQITKEVAASMPPSEWAKLSSDEKKRIINS